MVVIDATHLMLFLRPDVGVPTGPGNVPIDRPLERINYLINELGKARTRIIIPAPVLSEVLVRVPPLEAQKLVEQIGTFSIFRIEPFDARAAIELAIMTRNVIDGGKDPRRRNAQQTYAKLKFDRQIVAIAKVIQATTIYSDDGDIRNIGKRENIQVVGLADLPLPPENPQADMFKNFTPTTEVSSDAGQSEDARTAPPEASDGQGAIQALPPDRKGD